MAADNSKRPVNLTINGLATRVVVPLRAANRVGPPMRDLNPVFEVGGKKVVLDTAALDVLFGA